MCSFLVVCQDLVKKTELFTTSKMEKKPVTQYHPPQNMAVCYHKKYIFADMYKIKRLSDKGF